MIRLVQPSDQEQIGHLLYQVHAVHAAARPDLFKTGQRKFTEAALTERIADTANPIFVYEGDGQIKGYVFCDVQVTVDHSSLQNRKVLFIDDLCVDENQRGQRIGEQLYQYVRAYAKENQFDSVTLHVWNDNAGALHFYERLGMTAQVTTMEDRLKE